jgi:uncharacterized protein YecE (DUF72 family)
MNPPRIGTAGWSIPSQHTAAFATPGTHLERYSRLLNSAEINSSFHRSHRLSTWARWAQSTPPEFRFSVKAPKTITHQSVLASTPDQLRAFLDEARSLGPKLGPVLFQLPPKQAFDELASSRFLETLRNLHPEGGIVLEPRHDTWLSAAAHKILKEFQISRAAADPAISPEAAHPGGHPGLIYYRLHGSPHTYYSAYTEAFLQKLAGTIKASPPHAQLWCIFDNTTLGHALGNALALMQLIAFIPNSTN